MILLKKFDDTALNERQLLCQISDAAEKETQFLKQINEVAMKERQSRKESEAKHIENQKLLETLNAACEDANHVNVKLAKDTV